MRHGTLGPISLSARKWPKSFLSHDVCAVNKQISSDSMLSVLYIYHKYNINQTKRVEFTRAELHTHLLRMNLSRRTYKSIYFAYKYPDIYFKSTDLKVPTSNISKLLHKKMLLTILPHFKKVVVPFFWHVAPILCLHK